METKRDEKQEQFAQALKRLPPPVSCFSNGACCPWCGRVIKTITFGMNNCEECGKAFAFGYPDWHEGKDPVSWVPFPWREFAATGERADLIPAWEPNEQLKEIYFQKSEEELRSWAADNGTH